MTILESADLQVAINPQVGGTITAITVKASGLDVLGEVPWPVSDAPIISGAARDEPEFLTRYSGGWPLLFPNGGDACDFDGVFHEPGEWTCLHRPHLGAAGHAMEMEL